MKSCRTLFTAALAVALSGLFLLPASTIAQEYPSKAIKLIVPFPAGGATDIVSRVIAQQLGTELGQSVIVDNRAGAAGVIGRIAQVLDTARGAGMPVIFFQNGWSFFSCANQWSGMILIPA